MMLLLISVPFSVSLCSYILIQEGLEDLMEHFMLTDLLVDTSAEPHKFPSYTGFYYANNNDSIGMYWFINISWSFDFKSAAGQHIDDLFRFTGSYDYNGDRLLFYKENGAGYNYIFKEGGIITYFKL